MDVSGSGSGWSSGCESGWTLYLDESYVFPGDSVDNNVSVVDEHQNYRVSCEDDLSMVSDASSGPPHFHHDQDQDDDRTTIIHLHKKDKRSKKDKNKKQFQHLDDTASSPSISYDKIYENPSTTNQASFIGFSQNLSETHFQGNTAVSNHHYGFWPSSHPKNADSTKPSKLRGRRWE